MLTGLVRFGHGRFLTIKRAFGQGRFQINSICLVHEFIIFEFLILWKFRKTFQTIGNSSLKNRLQTTKTFSVFAAFRFDILVLNLSVKDHFDQN